MKLVGWEKLLSVCICMLLVCFVSSDWAIQLPSCITQSGKNETPCFIFTPIQDCCSLDSRVGKEFIRRHNITARRMRNHRFRYISFPFAADMENKFVLMLHHEMPQTPQLCWLVQLKANADHTGYDNAEIKFLLDGDFVAGWTAVTFNVGTCECERFTQSNTTFKATSSRRELEFDINWKYLPAIQLEVSLLSADYNITCNGSVNSGNVDPPVPYQWTNISNPWLQNVLIGYHCLTISMAHNKDCLIYTETKSIEDLERRTALLPTLTRLPSLILTAAICCVCIFGLILAAYQHRGRLKFSRIVPSNPPVVKTPLLAAKIKLLLLYSRDSDAFCKLVAEFRRLLGLSIDNIEVFDPFDELQFDNIARNSEVWLTELLYASSVKVVLITSEGAILRQRALLSGSLLFARQPHYLDVLFTSALNHLRNPQLSNDYKRMFVVRFDGLPSNTLSGITPFRRFMLPNHYNVFLKAITGTLRTRRALEYNTAPEYCRCLEEFHCALRKVLGHCDKTDVQQQWSLPNTTSNII